MKGGVSAHKLQPCRSPCLCRCGHSAASRRLAWGEGRRDDCRHAWPACARAHVHPHQRPGFWTPPALYTSFISVIVLQSHAQALERTYSCRMPAYCVRKTLAEGSSHIISTAKHQKYQATALLSVGVEKGFMGRHMLTEERNLHLNPQSNGCVCEVQSAPSRFTKAADVGLHTEVNWCWHEGQQQSCSYSAGMLHISTQGSVKWSSSLLHGSSRTTFSAAQQTKHKLDTGMWKVLEALQLQIAMPS